MKEIRRLLAQMLTIGTYQAAETDLIVDPGLDWIVGTERGSEVIVCGLAEGVFVQTLIIHKIDQEWNIEELLDWNFGACDEWSIGFHGKKIRVGTGPYKGAVHRLLNVRTNWVYLRSIEGTTFERAAKQHAKQQNVCRDRSTIEPFPRIALAGRSKWLGKN